LFVPFQPNGALELEKALQNSKYRASFKQNGLPPTGLRHIGCRLQGPAPSSLQSRSEYNGPAEQFDCEPEKDFRSEFMAFTFKAPKGGSWRSEGKVNNNYIYETHRIAHRAMNMPLREEVWCVLATRLKY
jgi:hypothetical protein